MSLTDITKFVCRFCMGWLLQRSDKTKKCTGCGYTVKNDGTEFTFMITMKELLSGNLLEDQPKEVQESLSKLLDVMNKIRQKYAKPMTVTSGLRGLDQHLAIYKKKGITDTAKIPMKSRHLFGLACDISDPKQELQKWCNENIDFLKQLGVFLEDFSYTKNWVHFQIVPYGSYVEGKAIFFKP
jgi:hypothetical protein